jgi:hypothetical protein
MNATGSTRTATMRHHQATMEASSAVVPPRYGSRAEGAPVPHNRHKPVSLDAPQGGNDRTARNTVLAGQLRHRGQPFLRLPFTRADSRTQRGLNTLARQLRRAVRRHPAMIANTV